MSRHPSIWLWFESKSRPFQFHQIEMLWLLFWEIRFEIWVGFSLWFLRCWQTRRRKCQTKVIKQCAFSCSIQSQQPMKLDQISRPLSSKQSHELDCLTTDTTRGNRDTLFEAQNRHTLWTARVCGVISCWLLASKCVIDNDMIARKMASNQAKGQSDEENGPTKNLA